KGSNTGRKRLDENTFSASFYETYYRSSLPRQKDWYPGNDAHCPFHDDQVPSLSLDIRDGMGGWYCHRCEEGGGIVAFEMKLIGTEDPREARESVARKMGLRLVLKPRGTINHNHAYRNSHGGDVSSDLGSEDGTA